MLNCFLLKNVLTFVQSCPLDKGSQSLVQRPPLHLVHSDLGDWFQLTFVDKLLNLERRKWNEKEMSGKEAEKAKIYLQFWENVTCFSNNSSFFNRMNKNVVYLGKMWNAKKEDWTKNSNFSFTNSWIMKSSTESSESKSSSSPEKPFEFWCPFLKKKQLD